MENVPSVLIATNNTKGVGFKINKCLGFCKLKWHTFSFEPYIGFGANGNTFGWGMLAMLSLGAFVFLITCGGCSRYSTSSQVVVSLGQKNGLIIC